MRLEMKDIRLMIENNDISLKKYILCCDEYENNAIDLCIKDKPQICCLIDPINIKLNEFRQIDINNTSLKINTFFIDRNQFQSIENNTDKQHFKIRYVGSVSMNKENNEYCYKWITANKKKKDILITKWIPYKSSVENIISNTEEETKCLIDNIFNFFYSDTQLHQIVIYYQQVKSISSYLLFKIKSHYYVRHPTNKNSLLYLF